MRLIILTIFAICMAGTAKAQTDFDFTCELTCSEAAASIAAIPDAMMDDPDDLYDRVAYLNNIETPDGFSIYANDERVTIYEGEDPQNGDQRWYYQGYYNGYEYVQFNYVYRIIHRVLINLEYGCDVLDGI